MTTYNVEVVQYCYFEVEAASKEEAEIAVQNTKVGQEEEYIWDETANGYRFEIEAEEVTEL